MANDNTMKVLVATAVEAVKEAKFWMKEQNAPMHQYWQGRFEATRDLVKSLLTANDFEEFRAKVNAGVE